MCIHEEGQHLALSPGAQCACHWSHGSCTFAIGLAVWAGKCGRRLVPVAESAFQGDYKSDPQGVVTSLGLLSFVDPSSMHPSFSTFYGAPFLAPSHWCWREGSGGEEARWCHGSMHPSQNSCGGVSFQFPSFMFLRCPLFYDSDISRVEMHLKNSCCIVV